MSEHPIFDICVEPIELYKLLKISNLVGDGEAKTLISDGKILVNKKVEVQKRKKIRRGDVIDFDGKTIEVAYTPTKKSAEFISTVVSANNKSKIKKRAKSKARAIAAETASEKSVERSKRKSESV
jgi:ribosome-associated protein